MSRIGNASITIPKDVQVTITGSSIVVKGPKGERSFLVPTGVSIALVGDQLTAKQIGQGRPMQALHGLVRAILANDVIGVTTGWTKTLELSGVGYRAAMSGETIVLTVGFSHPVTVVPPPGITFHITEGKIIVSGIDKQLVGQVAAKIREIKKPEPYKGKGIKYSGEYIRKKAGKAKAAGATGAK